MKFVYNNHKIPFDPKRNPDPDPPPGEEVPEEEEKTHHPRKHCEKNE